MDLFHKNDGWSDVDVNDNENWFKADNDGMEISVQSLPRKSLRFDHLKRLKKRGEGNDELSVFMSHAVAMCQLDEMLVYF